MAKKKNPAQLVRISRIKVGDRIRRNLGDIESLAESMKNIGLIHPIRVTSNMELVAGMRRLEAAKKLKWKEIAVTIVDDNVIQTQRDENTCRENFSDDDIARMVAVLDDAGMRPQVIAEEISAIADVSPSKVRQVRDRIVKNSKGEVVKFESPKVAAEKKAASIKQKTDPLIVTRDECRKLQSALTNAANHLREIAGMDDEPPMEFADAIAKNAASLVMQIESARDLISLHSPYARVPEDYPDPRRCPRGWVTKQEFFALPESKRWQV